MARVCQLTGKKPVKGNNVSHSNKKTRREFGVNLKIKSIFVPELNKYVTLKLSASAIKTINKKGAYAAIKEAVEKGFLKKDILTPVK
ncbi:MAG: 50S ribosomal protein L28 [Bacteroidetes bacterium]|jgi:large subunit ribosomal protein L28|nr:MAG: 50S ribosomal protein L28 [Bacteroidota bacterium]